METTEVQERDMVTRTAVLVEEREACVLDVELADRMAVGCEQNKISRMSPQLLA